MRILWVKTDFLHPADRGGRIRTLEMLRRIHQRHEVHYVAYEDPDSPQGRERAVEYSASAYPVNRPIAPRGSPRFFAQLAANLASPLPLAVGRYKSAAMKEKIAGILSRMDFDAVVCDYLAPAPNIPDLGRAVLFQHNVESLIWKRHARHAQNPVRRAYFDLQAERMLRCEGELCRRAAHVVSVSPKDTEDMKSLFRVERISEVPTGVDIDFFARLPDARPEWDLVFAGAMDWLPNVDGAGWFASEILPRIRARRPETSVLLAGRNPDSAVLRIACQHSRVHVTGTVTDIRRYLWNSAVSIVPLRVGGGTRLKIYEAMAAGTPVISTHVGAEGLAVTHGADILLASDPAEFAEHCLCLLASPSRRAAQAACARELVARFSWNRVAVLFENILEGAARSLVMDAAR